MFASPLWNRSATDFARTRDSWCTPKHRPTAHSPRHPAWTHRFKPRNQPPRFELYDQIWLSPTLEKYQTAAWIDRRTRHPGDGSDHDPAWVILDL